MKHNLAFCGVLAVALFGGSQAGWAGDKIYSLGKDGLKIEGKIDDDDKKVKFFPVPEKEFELPGKLFQVKLAAGKKYKVTMDSADLDSVLVVKDAAGKQLAWDDDSGGKLNSLLTFQTEKAGAYKIYALSLKGTGDFTLKVTDTDAPVGKVPAGGKVYKLGKDGLKIEGKVDGTDTKVTFNPVANKEFALPGKLYQVSLAGGKKFKVTMDSADFDCVLVVKDAEGKQLAWDDDSGGGLNSLLTFETGKAGTYNVYALSLTGTGNFVLVVTAVGDDARLPAPSGNDAATVSSKR